MTCVTAAAACSRERAGCSRVRHITSLVTDTSYFTSLQQFLLEIWTNCLRVLCRPNARLRTILGMQETIQKKWLLVVCRV